MKKNIYLSLILFLVTVFFSGQVVLADPPTTPPEGDGGIAPEAGSGSGAEKPMTIKESLDTAAKLPGLNKASSTNIPQMVGKVVGVVIQFVSLLFLIIIVYAGLRWMLAKGDAGKVKEARGWMIHGAIGLLITLMAYQIVNYIFEKIEIKGAAHLIGLMVGA